MLVIDRENSGLIFANDDPTSDKAPDYTGVINVEGTQYQIALWNREFDSGAVGFGVKISEVREAEESRPQRGASRPAQSRPAASRTAPSRGNERLTPRAKPSRR